MTTPLCPCCGHPLSDDEVEVVLRPKERKLYQALLRGGQAGITNSGLMDHVYADDPDGGSLDSNVIAVMASRMRPLMKPFGLTIRASGGPGCRYHLEKLEEKVS
jgi:DNA-binding response OmpR family regulator